MILLDGKKVALQIKETLKKRISSLKRKPGLAFLLVGDHPPSEIYVKAKVKASEEVGIVSHILRFEKNVKEKVLSQEIERLNLDPHIDGILIQLPLPSSINTQALLDQVDPEKDVDGLHPINMGKLLMGREDGFCPCTPKGIHTLLKAYKIPIEGKNVVIVGRSNLVGKPMAALLMQKKEGANATVTLAHQKTHHLEKVLSSAEILISATGTANSITERCVQKNAVVIDVGIHRDQTGKIIGDVDFEKVSPLVQAITPVPKGVGPMTIASLLENTFLSVNRKDNGL